MTFPVEMRYAKKKVFWPDISNDLTQKNFHEIIKKIDLEWSFKNSFRTIDEKITLSNDLYGNKPLNFDYESFLNKLMNSLNRLDTWNHSFLINEITKAFFSLWDNGVHFCKNALYTVNHMSMMCFASAEYFFRNFPNGKIIQTVRSPWDFYASMQKHFKTTHEDSLFFKYSMKLWRESTIRAIINSREYKNYMMLRYEDLVANWQATSTEIVSFLGINYISDVPTLGSSLWQGNSSYGSKKQLDSSSLFKGEKYLSKYQINYIDENFYKLTSAMGYKIDSLNETQKLDNYHDKLLMLDIKLTDENNEYEKLKEENKRLSSLLFSVHRDLVQDIKARS